MNVSHCNGKSGLIEESLTFFFFLWSFAPGITELFDQRSNTAEWSFGKN